MSGRAAALAGILLLAVTACTSPTAPGSPAAPGQPAPEAGDVNAAEAGPQASPSPPASSPSPSPSPSPPPPDRAALVARLVEAARFPDGAQGSVTVLDDHGRVVFEVAGEEPVLPASTAKLATGAAALLLFGPDHRIPTVVEAAGSLGEDGVLRGRLELVGGGDPALAQEAYRSLVYVARPHTELEQLADAVVASGVRAVTRGVAPAPDAFGDTPEAPGWKDDYLAVLDARRITALTVDAGLDLTVVKQPPDPELELVAAADPAQRAATVFTRLLRERGVVVSSSSRTGAVAGERTVLGEATSPPIREHVRFAFERSDNHTADTLFRLVGAVLGARDWATSGEAVARLLTTAGVDTTGMELVDGAGLSRQDRVSTRTLASIDQVMRSGEHGEVWREALAVAGEEGTLRRRLRDTVAAGRFLGKSGTLDDVTALVGTVEGPDGEAAYHVAAIANVAPGTGRFGSLVVINDLVALLAEDAVGCVRVSPPEDVADDEFVIGGLYVECPQGQL